MGEQGRMKHNSPSLKTADKNSRRWPLFLAIALLIAIVIVGVWAAYRMLDPVVSRDYSGTTCHDTQNVGDRTGIITAPNLELQHGKWIDVQSLEMIDDKNYKLSGAGVQNQVHGIGGLNYPLFDNGTAEATAWKQRDLLPARIGDTPIQSIIYALEPIDPLQESSLQGMRMSYTNRWGIPYSLDIETEFRAMPQCSADDDEE